MHKTFGATPALRAASLDLYAGEVVAVTGRSGSGKSTLLHCLAGVTVPDTGAVVYDGQRLDHCPSTTAAGCAAGTSASCSSSASSSRS